MDDIIEIATFGTAFEARAVKAHLASEGIRASVLTDNAGGAIPSMSLLEGGVRLVVAASDVERARSVLEERFSTDDTENEGDEGDEGAEVVDETTEWDRP